MTTAPSDGSPTPGGDLCVEVHEERPHDTALTTVDARWPEAIQAADLLLPPTGTIFDCGDRKRATRVYRCQIPAGRAAAPILADPMSGEPILTVRDGGAASLSVHPETGELLERATTGQPFDADGDTLYRRGHHTAAAALLRRHWAEADPPHLTHALTRLTAAAGWPAARTRLLVEAASGARDNALTGDDALTRLFQAAAAIARDPEHDAAALADLIAPEVATAVTDWLTIAAAATPEQPETAAGGERITGLHARGGKVLTKTYAPGPDGPVRRDFDQVRTYRAAIYDAATIHDLSALLTKLEGDPTAALVRGIPAPGIDLSRPIRRLKVPDPLTGDPATLMDQDGGRSFAMIDLDKVAVPVGLDITRDPEAVVRALVQASLPDAFQDVSCHWQFSSSAGMGDPGIVSIHVWFWFDRRVADDALKAALAGCPVDESVFGAVQLHYVARPVFTGGLADPLPRRSGLYRGARDTVALPPHTAETRRPNGGGAPPEAALEDIEAALDVIPNADRPWATQGGVLGWNVIGMAAWRASGGAAFDAFDRFSQRSGKYDAAATVERWEHYPRSPPSRLGAGTLFFLARQAVPGWRKPSEDRRRTEPITPTYPATNVHPAGHVCDAIVAPSGSSARRQRPTTSRKPMPARTIRPPSPPLTASKPQRGRAKAGSWRRSSPDPADRPLRYKPGHPTIAPLVLSTRASPTDAQDERSPAAVLMTQPWRSLSRRTNSATSL